MDSQRRARTRWQAGREKFGKGTHKQAAVAVVVLLGQLQEQVGNVWP